VKNLITYYFIIFTWIEFDSIHSQCETAEFDPVKKLIPNKNYNEAINFLMKILIDNPSNFDTVFYIGSIFFMMSRYDDAKLYLEKAEKRTL